MHKENTMKAPAKYWNNIGGQAHCSLCPHQCVITEQQRGFCAVRKHVNGKLISENYGQITSLALDPIEKKPLRHFYPGSFILSAGSFGCNMQCSFCQNHAIAQAPADSTYLPPGQLVDIAVQTPDNIGVAFTYNEPTVGIEYILACAPLLKEAGLQVVLVSNGQINAQPLADLAPCVDAWNIDLKSFSEQFYRQHGGDLTTVQQTIATAAQTAHVEITTLIIPGENDNDQEISSLSTWLSGISEEIPLHLSRFFPRYRMTDKLPTPPETLYRLAAIAAKRLRHVHIGNI